MKRSFSFILLALTCFVCGSGTWKERDQEEPILLQYKLKEGQELFYQVKEAWQFADRGDQNVTQKLRVKIVKSSDEWFTTHCSVESAQTDDDQDFVQAHISAFAGMSFDIDFSRSGAVKHIQDADAQDCQTTRHSRMMGYGFMGLCYPATPVRIGDTWTAQYDRKKEYDRAAIPTEFSPSGVVTRTFKLLGLTEKDGKKVAKIEATSQWSYTIDGSMQTMKFNDRVKGEESALYTVELATGLPIDISERSSYESTNTYGNHDPLQLKGGAKSTISLTPPKAR